MKKARIIPLVLLFIFLVSALSGCGKKKYEVKIEEAKRVSVYYGVSSYAMFTSDENTVNTLKGCFSNLKLEPTQEKIDVSTMLSLYFYISEKDIVLVSVDDKGVFELNGDSQCLKDNSGNFSYEAVKNIYEQNKVK